MTKCEVGWLEADCRVLLAQHNFNFKALTLRKPHVSLLALTPTSTAHLRQQQDTRPCIGHTRTGTQMMCCRRWR